jgi:hypothetical protein
MKTLLIIAVWAVLLIAVPGPCFAGWQTVSVSKEGAKEMGIEVRTEGAGPDVGGGPNHVRMEVDFRLGGKLKDVSGVTLRIGDGDTAAVTVLMREDRSKPDRIMVDFTANPDQLGKLTLWVWVPELDGGPIYEFRVKDLAELKKDR